MNAPRFFLMWRCGSPFGRESFYRYPIDGKRVMSEAERMRAHSEWVTAHEIYPGDPLSPLTHATRCV